MQEYKREYPLFSLCGLNCGLCPRYHTDGKSKCPGCGGKDFYSIHPTCAVVTCSKKHGNIEYCFECSCYPCERYNKQNNKDSFITYKNRKSDIERARKYGIDKYKAELNEKVEILNILITNYNDGKRKNFYCTAVNLFKLKDLRNILDEFTKEINLKDITEKEKIELMVSIFKDKAEKEKIEIELRK
jgi:hypothetical protein